MGVMALGPFPSLPRGHIGNEEDALRSWARSVIKDLAADLLQEVRTDTDRERAREFCRRLRPLEAEVEKGTWWKKRRTALAFEARLRVLWRIGER
jgi:ribosomal protein L17